MAGGRTGRDTTGRDAAAPPRAAESRCSGRSTQAPPFPTAAPLRRVPPGPPPAPPPLRIRGAGPSPSRPAPALRQPGPQPGQGPLPSRKGGSVGVGGKGRSCPAVDREPRAGHRGLQAPGPQAVLFPASGAGSGPGAKIGRGWRLGGGNHQSGTPPSCPCPWRNNEGMGL